MEKEKNKFYKKIDPYLSRFSGINEFDKGVINCEYNVIVHQTNQSIKTILATRAFEYTQKNIFYITRDDKIAEEIMEDFEVLVPPLVPLINVRENNPPPLNPSPPKVFFIPDYETLPDEKRSPHYMIRAQRMRAISHLLSGQPAIYVMSYKNFIRNIINPEYIQKNILHINISDDFDPSELILYLTNCGYEYVSQIEKVGQFSKRGGIIDIFSPNYQNPLRFEFWGDEIISIRSFSVETQRSEKREIKGVTIIPCREVILNEETKTSPLSEKIAEKGFYEGIEQDISILYKGRYSLVNYTQITNYNLQITNQITNYNLQITNVPPINVEEEGEEKNNTIFFFDKIEQITDSPILHNQLSILHSPSPTPDSPFSIIHSPSSIIHSPFSIIHYPSSIIHSPLSIIHSPLSLHADPSPFFNSDLQILEEHINSLTQSGYTIFIQNENEAQKNRMIQLLGESANKVHLTIGVLHKGFIFHDIKVAVFTDHEIFKRVKHKKLDIAFSRGEALVDYESLKPGDYIVHIDHGIGIYEGIKVLSVGDKKIECLTIQYAGTDKVYVPTWQLSLVAKYVSEEGTAPHINKIGTKTWETIKQKARKSIELVVDDIVNLYAERKLRKGIVFQPDTDWQLAMEAAFIYDDTPDQITATNEIKKDMEKDLPMERLLCGDVGFGKTEVAIRVAFKAVMSDYQVAVVVPTTLLADQHYQVFRERLAQFPVKIALLSRFRTNAQIKNDLELLKKGEIDIVIGTHRLFSNDVAFKRIGLLIIDEEHRFGVKHKEKIRQLKANVDTLYMSATPIPRTMNMILSKLKAMSLIQTSPKARLPIRTVIVPYNTEIIKDAIQREIDRGGQVYFVHNRVETIETIYIELRNLMPHIRIIIGHGQLPERQLEKVLVDFAEHKYDVLLATTIIESGIDIPNTNTILINRADMFGLAQLYQIRGRVGRSNRRAYAYLIIPKKLHEIARKRLETLTEYESLGAGYHIAMRDLEIRGAGTLLGTKQSGVITSVGFNFYNKLLDQAVKNILKENPKGMWDEDENREELRQIELGTDFYFPADFITDERQKLQIYKRMVAFEKEEDFDELATELKDRYGSLPELANNVLEYFKIRFLTKKIGLKSFMILTNKMIVEYDEQNLPHRKILANLIASSEVALSFDTTDCLRIVFDFSEEMARDKKRKLLFALSVIRLIS